MSEIINTFSHNLWLFICVSFLFAAVIGSFLNVVIHRLPVILKREWQQECNQYLQEYHKTLLSKLDKNALDRKIDSYPEKYNLIVPTSTCPKCNTKIKPWHNLPILGWLMLKGKCASCEAGISARYPIIEFITAVLVSVLAWHFGPTLQFLFSAILTFCLVALTGIDLDEMLLPDQITLPLLWLGILVNLNGIFVPLDESIIGAMVGYLSLWSVFWLFKLATGKEGMGYGDFKLLAVFGAWLGWQSLPLIILLSSLVGAFVGISLIITKRLDSANPIPFGPYIAVAGWISLIWGQDISNWYLSTL